MAADASTPSGRELDTEPRHNPGGQRSVVLLSIAAAGLWAFVTLGLDPRDLVPGAGGLTVARELFGHALAPAWTYESPDLPPGIRPLPIQALAAAWHTVTLAAAATGLSVAVGLLLACAASTAPWSEDPWAHRRASGWIRALVFGCVRLLIAGMRSVHELLWAVLLLAAVGLEPLSAVVAIAIPHGGILAKIFAEILDEAPRDAALALHAAGASPSRVFLFGLLPRALPDMCAYAAYRFECALRSSAVLGFFGFPTLGFFIAASFENLYYGELWTYLYTLCALVALADAWSGALRRRLVG